MGALHRTGNVFVSLFCLFCFFVSFFVSSVAARDGAQLSKAPVSLPEDGVRLSEEGEASLTKAQGFMDSGAYDYAVDELTRALSKEEHGDIHWFLGKAYLGAGERKLAYYSFKRACSCDSTNVDVLSSLADLSLEYGTVAECERLIPLLKSSFPQVVETFGGQIVLKKADEAFDKRNFTRAFRYYEEVFSSHPALAFRAQKGCMKSLSQLADAFGKARKYTKELKILLRQYQIEPSKDLSLRISRVWVKSGSPDDLKRQVQSIAEHGSSL